MPRTMLPHYIEKYRDQSRTYEMFNPEGRLHVVCPQCRALVLLCDSLPRSDRQKIAATRMEQPAAAMETLKTMLPCGDREAKAIVAHLRKPHGGCSHCGTEMPRGALLCPNCWSVNLDWA
ncbi:hypothetical protein AAFN88_20010 [Pelagibius sp. CAU 1746]|uniref:hypothetical protein n=1 Tax=Pelagibius sp. CAU 1746 TaxID=3140370 RepID=UPI00325A749C